MITLASKKARLLLFIIMSNICKAAANCYSSECPMALPDTSCCLKERHLSQFVVQLDRSTSPIINQLTASCVNDISCSECELNVPGTNYCGFSRFVDKVTYR